MAEEQEEKEGTDWAELFGHAVRFMILVWSAALLTLSYWEPPNGKKIVDFDPTFIASIFSASTASLGLSIGKKGNNKKEVILDNKNSKSGIK